jgi:uncharacterized protein
LQPLVRQALDDGADVNVSVKFSGTLRPIIQVFIARGNILCIDELLVKKPNLEKCSSDDYTSIQAAMFANIAESVKVRIVRLLLRAGADINANHSEKSCPILLAVKNNLSEVVEEVLRNQKPDFTRSSIAQIGTALAVAAANGNEAITRDLIKAGAKLESQRKGDKATPLLVAAEFGQEKIIQLLITARAKKSAVTNQGNTALHLAARNGHSGACEVLIRNNVEMDTKNKLRQTALDLAILAEQTLFDHSKHDQPKSP